VSRSLPTPPAVLVIRFTRRIARECGPQGSRLPDWVVCDTIANGRRHPLAGTGSRGGRIVRFERAYPADPRVRRTFGGPPWTLAVLGELTPDGCFALRLARPRGPVEKNRNEVGFLHRAGAK
jgi:hypothetical protein